MFGINFGKKEPSPSLASMQAEELGELRKNTQRNELLDRIEHLKKNVELAGPNAEARASFEKQIADAQALLKELDGSPEDTSEKTDAVN